MLMRWLVNMLVENETDSETEHVDHFLFLDQRLCGTEIVNGKSSMSKTKL